MYPISGLSLFFSFEYVGNLIFAHFRYQDFISLFQANFAQWTKFYENISFFIIFMDFLSAKIQTTFQLHFWRNLKVWIFWGFFCRFYPLCIKSLFGFFRVMKERERVLLSNIEFCIFDDARWCRGGRKAEGP